MPNIGESAVKENTQPAAARFGGVYRHRYSATLPHDVNHRANFRVVMLFVLATNLPMK
jgi:hypothetical protein